MAKSTAISMDRPTQILIERRETVAVVNLSPHGTVNPIVAAYNEIGEVFARSDEPMRVQFEWEGHVFEAGHEPIADHDNRMSPPPSDIDY